ncbi:MAG TPA: efflux RND transporter periplasmic adaptor subunit [Terriglobales bacterium]|nr:efflux RND transporter periplasmic adaptor subunit [Terriglobales bacterium]
MKTLHKAGNIRHFFLFAVICLSLGLLAGCQKKEAAPQGRPAVPVTVANVEQRNMPLQVTAIGTVEPFSTVQIRTQVTGQLTGVHFKEGDDVRKGQLLFELDRRPLEADLKKAEGQLARDLASLANAKAQAARYDALFKAGVISREQYEQQQTQQETFAAAVEADRAAVEYAKVQLTYTKIYAPIDGRTGNLIVHEGNMVKANDTPALVVINKIQPVYVTFSVPESELHQIKQFNAKKQLAVEARIAGDPKPSTGKLTFIDNEVDSATGTIRLKGEFANGDRRLWPGAFSDVSLTLANEPNAVVVPTAALQNGQQGQYVFVVKSDKSVELRNVSIDRGNDKVSVVHSGLQPGETVVTDGQVRLVPGAKIELSNKPTSAAEQPAAVTQGSGS